MAPSHGGGPAIAIAQLAERMAGMEKAFNHNTQLVINSIQMLEIQGQTFRRVIDDLYAELRPLVKGLDKPDDMRVKVKDNETIDWQTYLNIFVDQLREAQAKHAAAPPSPPPPVVASASAEEPLVFGG